MSVRASMREFENALLEMVNRGVMHDVELSAFLWGWLWCEEGLGVGCMCKSVVYTIEVRI